MSASGAMATILVLWTGILALLISYKLLVGQISARGILLGRNGQVSPVRIQLLVTTVIALVGYAGETLDKHKLPVLPETMVVIFGASHLIYLSGKSADQWIRKERY